MVTPKVLIPMADYGHDPTETSVPYTTFKKAGFEVYFATENGKTPQCDKKMLKGLTQKLLGATSKAVSLYNAMSQSPEFRSPLAWTSPSFSLAPYNLVFLPGGHEKGVRQLIDSGTMQSHLASYFPQTEKTKNNQKAVAAVCHGVMALAEAKFEERQEGEDTGNAEEGESKLKSVLHDAVTTALPARFEQAAFWSTRLFLGDYYKTYGVGSDDVQLAVSNHLRDPKKQYKNSLSLKPFVVEDPKYNYISARFPGDAELLAEKTVAMVKAVTSQP